MRYSDEAFWVMVFYFDSKIWQEGGAITEGVQHNPDETLWWIIRDPKGQT